jgi:hypothetical protein
MEIFHFRFGLGRLKASWCFARPHLPKYQRVQRFVHLGTFHKLIMMFFTPNGKAHCKIKKDASL